MRSVELTYSKHETAVFCHFPALYVEKTARKARDSHVAGKTSVPFSQGAA